MYKVTTGSQTMEVSMLTMFDTQGTVERNTLVDYGTRVEVIEVSIDEFNALVEMWNKIVSVGNVSNDNHLI